MLAHAIVFSVFLLAAAEPERKVTILEVAAGDGYACALQSDGVVACWGGMIPEGVDRMKPLPVPGLTDAVRLSGSTRGVTACAVTKPGQVVCWHGFGLTRLPTPVPLPGLSGASQVSVWKEEACAVHSNGRVSCWHIGSDRHKGLKHGPPSEVKGLSDAVEVKTGSGFSCARRREGQVVCWGENRRGQLGNPALPERVDTPSPVVGVEGATGIFVATSSACATQRGGETRCWGPENGAVRPPTPTAELAGATDIALYGASECAVLKGGTLSCQMRNPPAESDVTALAGGVGHTCLLRRDGTVACFGSSEQGTLGAWSGDSANSTPGTVQGLPLVPTGKEEAGLAHPFLVSLRRTLHQQSSRVTQLRLEAIPLEGTLGGDGRALRLFAVDQIVRVLGPRILEGVIRAGQWPRKGTGIVKKLERQAPLRLGGKGFDAGVMRELEAAAKDLETRNAVQLHGGTPISDALLFASSGLGALRELMDLGNRLVESEAEEYSNELLAFETAVDSFDDYSRNKGKKKDEAEDKPLPPGPAEAFIVKLLSDLAELARKPAP